MPAIGMETATFVININPFVHYLYREIENAICPINKHDMRPRDLGQRGVHVVN